MNSLVAQPERVSDDKVRIRQHGRLETVPEALLSDFFRVIRTDSHNPDAAPIKLGTQFLEPP
jgi:hypothetical protein